MGKVLRAYAKDQTAISFLISTVPIPHGKDKPSPRERKDKRDLADEVQRSSRKRLLANRPFTPNGNLRHDCRKSVSIFGAGSTASGRYSIVSACLLDCIDPYRLKVFFDTFISSIAELRLAISHELSPNALYEAW